MSGNFGKFIDRSPIICPAGKVSGNPENTVARAFKWYSLQDEIDALKHDTEIFEEHQAFKHKQSPLQNHRHAGVYTSISPVLQTPVETHYQTLISDLKETPYGSYWNKEVGKVKDPNGRLPMGMDIVGTTFGGPTKTECAKDIIFPDKTVLEVLLDSQVGHDMYKKTHNDYNVGEKVTRGYSQTPFDPEICYGSVSRCDRSGIRTKRAMNWFKTQSIAKVSHIQAKFYESHPKVGKCLTPNNNIERVPKEFTFGKPSKRDFYGVEEMLKDAGVPPCVLKRDYHDWMSHLNQIRNNLKNRTKKAEFSLQDFYCTFQFYDKEHIGWLPVNCFYSICKYFRVNFEHDKLEPLLAVIGALTPDGMFNYEVFIKLVDINTSLPELIKIEDVPPKNQYYKTSYQASNCDFLKIDNSNMPPAGVPSIPHLGSDVSVASAVSPSMYTVYGLTYRDFFMPRERDFLKKLFVNIGYEFLDDTFNKLWDIGVKLDKTGLVCVDTFNRLVQESLPFPQLQVKK